MTTSAIVYLLTNSVNGKRYVGITRQTFSAIGRPGFWTGKVRSLETKKKISQTKLAKRKAA